MASVTIRNVSKVYNRTVFAVKDVSMEIPDKELLVIVGPSGCGKTSLLRMIAGLEEITSGDIFIDGERVNDRAPKDRDIAMVFQNYALYPHMNVYDNMAFGLKLRKFSRGEIERRVREVSRLLEIEPLLQRKPRELSGGQRQRVAMGRAIVREPKVFLMDEPLSNLDAQFRVQMRMELQKLQRRLGVTTLYVTHDQTEAMALGTRIAILREGVVQQVDPPLVLYEKPVNRFVAGFIGSPSMNFLSARVTPEGAGLCVQFEQVRLSIPHSKEPLLAAYKEKEILLGIRPEHFAEAAASELNAIECAVEVVEPMGSEIYLHLTSGSHALVARMSPATHAAVGEKIWISPDMERMYAFDPESGAALC